MKASLLTSVVLVSSVLFAGCGTLNRAPGIRMLDDRAEYEDLKASQEVQMREAGLDGFQSNPVPVRTRAKVAAVFVHPQEMRSQDYYFWGGWVSLVYEHDQWTLSKPGELRSAPGIVDITAKKPPKVKAPRVINAKPAIKK